MLAGLRDRVRIEGAVAVVVAHPDDETVAAGGSLHLMPELLLVHVTDGAPRRLGDAAREGFASPKAYAEAREAELTTALALCGTRPNRVRLAIPDQDASERIAEIADRLAGLFASHRVEAVLTHAYEGGHPDHDATALAVHMAAGNRLEVLEFAGYHAASGAMQTGIFLTNPLSLAGEGLGEGGPTAPRLPTTLTPTLSRQREREKEVLVRLSDAERARKRAMLACFRTQQQILSQFDPASERFRPAPTYDFSQPPHPGPLNYELWGWEITGRTWRRLAADALSRQCAA